MPLPSGWRPRARALPPARNRVLALTLAVVAILLAGCSQGAKPAATSEFDLTLVHSNDTLGKLDPCG